MKKVLLLWISLGLMQVSLAQDFNHTIKLEAQNIPNLGGVQAFAHAEYQGKYLIIGGRLDGLHRRQPNATFDLAGHNNQLILIDPQTNQVWTKAVSSLPTSIAEQLSTTNMQYNQVGEMLYLVGGYGYSTDSVDHITFPYLTAVNIPGVISAIINSTSLTPYFRQIHDEQLAITGAHLKKIYNTYYLVGGQRFDGRYNPMMHGTFVQTYADGYLKFQIIDNGTSISIVNKLKIVDAEQLHRRDYNVISQITKEGQEGLIAFSGVFQVQADIPYLNSVSIDSAGYSVNPNFSQYYNHYHCATIPLYDSLNNKMHNLFFGGIAQYYDSAGILVQDNNVPFVKTIARITRDEIGGLSEYKMSTEMPGYLGAGAEFLINQNIPIYSNGIIKLNSLIGDSVLLGYVYGGINSTAKNVFWINDGTQSTASSVLYKVLLVKNNATTNILNVQSINKLQLQIYPNPSEGKVHLIFNLIQKENVIISVYDLTGKLICERIITDAEIGENRYRIEEKNFEVAGEYMVYVTVGKNKVLQKLIIE